MTDDYIDRFNRRMSLSGRNIAEAQTNYAREYLDRLFEDDMSARNVAYMWSRGKNNPEDYRRDNRVPIRLFNETFSNANGVLIEFITRHDEPVVCGDIIFVQTRGDIETNKFYLCRESFNTDGIYWKGKLSECNHMLKWQDRKTGVILEYPCYDINSTQYNSGETSSRYTTIESAQHLLQLPADEYTVRLDSPQRFYLDMNIEEPSSFIVTQNDTTSYHFGEKGIVRVTVRAEPNDHETDRPDLGICDYFEVNTDPEPTGARIEIGYKSDEIKSGGNARTFTATEYDGNDHKLEGREFTWNIICEFADDIKRRVSGDSIILSIDNDDRIDERFRLVCTDAGNGLTASMVIKVVGLLNG